MKKPNEHIVQLVMAFMICLFAPIGFSASAKVELSFYSWLDPVMLQKYVEFANQYMQKRYPDVVVVGSTSVTNDKLLVSMAAGAGPDIYYVGLTGFETANVDKNT